MDRVLIVIFMLLIFVGIYNDLKHEKCIDEDQLFELDTADGKKLLKYNSNATISVIDGNVEYNGYGNDSILYIIENKTDTTVLNRNTNVLCNSLGNCINLDSLNIIPIVPNF